MTGIYEILCTIGDGDKLYTTESDFDHSYIADSLGRLREFTKEDARVLINHLKDMYFSEPTHIEVHFEYRDGMHEYIETAHYPIRQEIDYDNLSDEQIHALFVFGNGIDAGEKEMELAAEAEALCNPSWYWDGERLLRLNWRKVVKE
tara:strand:- start:1746 stop:2186 length:441 start_codon:yes stop_codon:yes gene_type:complete